MASTNYTSELSNLYGTALAYYSETSWVNTIEYFCTPKQPWLSITDSWWKCMKLITVTATEKLADGKCITRAWGSPDYSWTATDLATVKAYSYS